MTKEFYIKNRNKLRSKIDDNSIVILHSNYEQFKSADSIYDFKFNNNFYYMTGLKEPDITIIIAKVNNKSYEWLFIDENDPIKIKWVGKKYTKEEASNISGIDIKNVLYNSSFNAFLDNLLQNNRYSNIVVDKIYLDLERRSLPLYNTFALEFAKTLQNNYPFVTIKNIYNNIIELRMIKDEEEINEIKASIETTNRAILNIYKHASEINNERVAVAYHDFILTCEDKKTSFNTIMASGKNACILHYEDNNADVLENAMILMDLGSSTNGYASDISRTFPVSGKFTKRQKEIYEAVLDVNKKCIEYARADMTWLELNEYARKLLTKHLIRLNVMKKEEDLSKYYFHSIGHSLGIDVHDPNIASHGIKEGMVITIEPGLYIEEEGIGIRIEDDILITKDKAICLSKNIIKEVDEIEKYINSYKIKE